MGDTINTCEQLVFELVEFVYLKGRVVKTKGETEKEILSIYWFTPQLPTEMWVGSHQSQVAKILLALSSIACMPQQEAGSKVRHN